MIDRKAIDDVRYRLNVVDVISSRLAIKKTGVNYSACCPFHDEKSPSFTVSEKKQFFYCFGCGAGGDVFDFIQRYDGVSFIDSVEQLAKMAGVQIDREENPEGKRIIPRKVKEILWLDSAVAMIHEFDKKAGRKISYTDKQRVKLAWSRMIGLSKKWINV